MPKKPQLNPFSFWDYVPGVRSHRALQRKLDQALAEADAEYERTQSQVKEIHEEIDARAQEVKAIRTHGMKM